ncbi:ATP synthase subunit a [bioreactor metagenome]|uniref:ATP synthase subunit a n=1 Tax=bioreactor metagenome TaxID=1076179 RepID=A0A645IF32_9ZZZZ
MKGYLKSYIKPMPLLLPITLLERLIFPISLALRLFGNILAATVIMSLIYGALLEIQTAIGLVIPIPFHMYFDIFDGAIQAVIFTFLTMIQIKLIAEESSEEHEH